MMAIGPHQRRRFWRICTAPAQSVDWTVARVWFEGMCEGVEAGGKGCRIACKKM